MADYPDPDLVVRFTEIERETNRTIDWTIDSNYIDPTDWCRFTLYDEQNRAQWLKLEMQPVELILNGNSQFLGRVDKTEIESKPIAFECRDYISDLIECNADPTIQIKKSQTLSDALLAAFAPVGIDTIVSDEDFALRDIRSGRSTDGKPPPAGFKSATVEDYKPKVGEGLYEFGNRIVCRFGATMQPADARNKLFITRPNFEQAPRYSLFASDEDGSRNRNNIVTAKASRDFSKFPTATLFQGVGQDAAGNSKQINAEYDILNTAVTLSPELAAVLQSQIIEGRLKAGQFKGDNAKLYRFLYHRDEESRGSAQLDKAGIRAIAERLKDTLVYTATVRGHADPNTGAIWTVDTIVDVQDDIRDVHEPMWIAGRTLKFSKSEGSRTDLVCWRPGTFQI